MSTYTNAEFLLAWFRERKTATVSDIVAAGIMKSRPAAEAIQYAVRNGALERLVRSGASPKERLHYRITGIPLPPPRVRETNPSFDDLLQAWGISREPVALRILNTRRHHISDLAPAARIPGGS